MSKNNNDRKLIVKVKNGTKHMHLELTLRAWDTRPGLEQCDKDQQQLDNWVKLTIQQATSMLEMLKVVEPNITYEIEVDEDLFLPVQ